MADEKKNVFAASFEKDPTIFDKEKKPKKLGEYIMVEMGRNVFVPIERKNMTDEEWAKVRRTAKEAGTLVEDKVDAPAEPASLEDRERIRKMGKKIDKVERDRSEPDDLKDLQPEVSNDPGMSPRGQMQRLATAAVPPQNRSARLQGHERTRVMSELDISPTNNVTEEDIAAYDTKKNLENVVKENEAAAQMREGLDFTTPESRLTSTVNQRNKQPPSFQDVADNQDTQVSGTVTSEPGTVISNKPLRFGKDPLTTTAASEGIAPPTGEPPINFDGGMGEAPNPLARLLLPQTTALDNYREPSGAPDAGVPPAPGVVPPAPGVAGSSPKAPGPGGSVSASVKSWTPGSGELPQADDIYKQDRLNSEHAAETAASAVRLRVGVERNKELANSQIHADKIAFTAQNEKQRLEAVNTYDQTYAHGQESFNAIMAERRALMNQKVDPDAYYTKGGVGRGVLAAISGAMFGFTGQGMQFLQRMDNLAQQEVKNQQDELARKGDLLHQIAGDQKNVIAMGQARGLNAMQSIAAAKDAFYASVEDQFAKIAAESAASDPAVAANLQEKMAQIQQKRAETGMHYTQLTQQAAHQKVQDKAAMMNAGANMMEAKARMAAAGGGGKRIPMKPGEKETMADYLSLGDTLGRMSKEYKEARGDSYAATGAISAKLGVGGSTKSNRWDKQMDTFTQIIGRPLEGGVVREQDTARYKGSYIPNVSDTDELAIQKQKGLRDYATSKYTNAYNTHVASRTEGIENYPTPQEFSAHLGARMGLPGEAPEFPEIDL